MRVLFLVAIALCSCTGNNTGQTTATRDTVRTSNKGERPNDDKTGKADTAGGCFWQIIKRDTIVAFLSQNGNQVSGKLSFDNFEKDGSSGRVTGASDNGIIKLWYSFQSEGMNSVMEIWLKKEGDVLIRGTGEMEVKGDSSYFKNTSAVDFTGNQQMIQVACEKVPAKFK